jgi:hypothetical protein
MKKLLALLPVLGVLAGCAMGINHNVVQFDGKAYLIETHNRNAFGLTQWTEKTTYTEIRKQDIGRTLAKEYLQKVTEECNASHSTNSQRVYKCIVDRIQKY